MYKLIEKMNDLNNFTSTNHFIDYIYKEDIKPIIQSSLDKFFELEDKWTQESDKDNSNDIVNLEIKMQDIESDIKSEFQSIYENYEIDYRSAFELYEKYENDIDNLLEFPLSEYMYDNITLDKLIERVIEEAYIHALFFIYDFMD
jgi:hypothetical protein